MTQPCGPCPEPGHRRPSEEEPPSDGEPGGQLSRHRHRTHQEGEREHAQQAAQEPRGNGRVAENGGTHSERNPAEGVALRAQPFAWQLSIMGVSTETLGIRHRPTSREAWEETPPRARPTRRRATLQYSTDASVAAPGA